MSDWGEDLDDAEALDVAIALSLSLEESKNAVPQKEQDTVWPADRGSSPKEDNGSSRRDGQAHSGQSHSGQSAEVAAAVKGPCDPPSPMRRKRSAHTAIAENDEPDADGSFQSSCTDDHLFTESESDSHDSESKHIRLDKKKNVSVEWNRLVEELMDDYIRGLNRKTVKQNVREGVLINLPTHEEVFGSDPAFETPSITEWSEPKLERGNLSTVQKRGLLVTRRYVYAAIVKLGGDYGEGVFENRPPEVLDGHHLAGCINVLQMPVTKADSVVMMKLLRPEAQRRPGGLSDEKEMQIRLFIQHFNRLTKLARFPEEGRGLNAKGLNAKGLNEKDEAFAREPLPAFDYLNAPPEYYYVISWDHWCRIFDLLKMRVQPNGTVW